MSIRSIFHSFATIVAILATVPFAQDHRSSEASTEELAPSVQRLPVPVPGLVVAVPQDFTETPGVRELSSRLILRPWPRKLLQDLGLTPEGISLRHAAARTELRRHEILRHVSSTDDSIIRVPEGVTERQLAEALSATGLFQYVEPDWILFPLESPVQSHTQSKSQQGRPQIGSVSPTPTPLAPPRFPPLPGIRRSLVDTRVHGLPRCPDDPLFATQWHHQADIMNSCAAWGIWGTSDGTTGGPSVSIGFCDTGVRTTHEDLLLHRLEGYNAVDQLCESEGGLITPIYTHGTRTTGTATANSNNGIGVAGVGWNLSHRMVRVSNVSSGNAFLSDLQHGARISIENGDRIANVSYHGASSASNAGTATYIKSLGGLLLWGAGNTSSNYSQSDRDDDDLIVVGATDQGDNLASFSSYGTFVDLVAPGVGIVTSNSSSDNSYVTVNGTSYACPITSGICAMIWSAWPTLSPNDVERILKASADDIGTTGLDAFFGYGRVNLERALGSTWIAMPAADFVALSPTGISPLIVKFTDLSTGIPTNWFWDFGDGGTSTNQNPTHGFTGSGAYSVSLTASNGMGMDTTTQIDIVLVDIIPPVADFAASVTGGLSPLPIDFTDQSTGGVPTSWLWDFGDGATSTLQNPSHTYTASGFYTVELTVTNAYGTDTSTKLNYVAVDFIPPVAGFSATPIFGASPYVVNFTDESTAGVATSWSWVFGDGGTSSLQNPVHTYTVAGTYSVRLTVSNAYGSDSLWLTNYIEVLPGPTILANFTGTPTTGTAPLQVDFTDLSIGNIVSWDWNFGDGGSSSLQNPTYIFSSPNEYDIALTVTNAQGKDSCLELGAFVTVQ